MKKLLLVVLVLLGLNQTQAQINWCDSLSYSIVVDSTSWNTLTVTGNANGIINMVDSISWNFTACNSTTCYPAQGNNPYSFPLITPNDTVKLCYEPTIWTMNTTTTCMECDSLVYDFNTDTWVLLNMGNPTSINELTFNKFNDNKIYDLMGKELREVPVGVMYIRNRKLYIKTK